MRTTQALALAGSALLAVTLMTGCGPDSPTDLAPIKATASPKAKPSKAKPSKAKPSKAPAAAQPSLKYDCAKVMTKTRDLAEAHEAGTPVYNSPDKAKMPTSEDEWGNKNDNTYPGSTCVTIGDTTGGEALAVTLLVFPASKWYADNILYIGDDMTGNVCQTVTGDLPHATKATYCVGDSQNVTLNATYPTALVSVTVMDSRTDQPDYRTALESDVNALQLR